MVYIAVFIAAYLIGSINSSIIVGKFNKVDIRKLGSGNAGATNTLRSLGVSAVVWVIAGDILKGIIAVILGRIIVGNEIGAMAAGLAAVIGHNWPIYFQFKGGKGILTSAVVILMIAPQIGIWVIAIAILTIAVTRYVSLGSLTGALIFPIFVLIMEFKNINLVVFSVIIAGLAVYRHRANIKRLREGTESKIGKRYK